MQSLSVIIPVYNGSGSLSDLVQRLEAVLPPLSSAHELILVNDASLDDSWQVIERLTQEHGWVRGIDLARNYGQHNALLCGIREARGDIIVTMDDDLQHPPEELPRVLDRLEDGTDVVYGTPVREQHGLWRILASRVSKIVLQRAMGAEAARSISAFRAFRRQGALALEALWVFPLLKSLLPVVVAFLLPTTDTLDHRRVGNGTHRHGLFQEPMEELPAMA